jgi:hypothetical protein
MGSGHFSDDHYQQSRSTRAAQGKRDFEYTETATSVHETLDPKRILKKPFHLLESRDSTEHPISTPIIVSFDVTGSNMANAIEVQKELPTLMAKLQAIVENPQIAIWANDDFKAVGAGSGRDSVQMGEFESDNRIDDTIRNIWLTNNGGGNGGESYDLLLYGAARKTVTDSIEKRNKKGYMFMYADEHFRDSVMKREVQAVFGDGLEADIPIAEMIEEVLKKWEVFVIWPSNGYASARDQYMELFGSDHVITLEAPKMICEQVTSTVSKFEDNLQHNAQQAVADAAEDYVSRVV